MLHLTRGVFSMWVHAFALTAFFATGATAAPIIQNVSGPVSDIEEVLPIRGTVTYLEADTVKYGFCKDLETFCYPNSASFTLRREISFARYQELLAEHFNIPSQYLTDDSKMDRNFQKTSELLKNIVEDESASDEEKAKAREKLDALTQKEGLINRFNRARALKLSLKWDPSQPDDGLARFEKSQVEFAQSNWPLNFVPDIDVKDALTLFEPSTEKTWKTGGRNMNRKQAGAACAAMGYRLPSEAEWKYSEPWLKSTAIGNALRQGNGKFWLSNAYTTGVEVRLEKFSRYSDRPYTVIEWHWNPTFAYAKLKADSFVADTVVITGSQKQLTDEEIETESEKTPVMDVLCITDRINP